MRPFEFSLMELVRRADEALAMERSRKRPDPLALGWLSIRRAQLAARLRRSMLQPQFAGS